MRRDALLLTLPFITAIGVLLTLYRHLDDVTRDVPSRFAMHCIEQMTGAYGAWLLMPLVVYLVRRYGLRAPLVHIAGVIVFSAVHTTSNLYSRKAIYALLGRGDYDYGRMPARFAMEFPNDVIVYAITAVLVWLLDRYRRAREREVALARAELDNLRLQLQPHFLFNSLNTISSVMYDDPARADRMIARLSEILRQVLRDPPVQEAPLEEELRTLQIYLEIMQARFGDRLQVECRVDPETRSGMVPYMILQPLVENVLRHGATPGSADLRITLAARRRGDLLELEVEDQGPGITGPLANGIGLKNTSERLRRLYGDRSEFRLENRDSAGLTVSIRIPFRTA